MSSSSNVLSVYKKMLKLARLLPVTQRASSLAEIRTQFRAHKETGADDVARLLEKANSSLGYLKILTPRNRQQATPQSGATKIVFGSSDAGGRKAVTNWTGSNMDPDSVRRHQNNLKRAGFRGNKDAKGVF